jgi:hypothetical protein
MIPNDFKVRMHINQHLGQKEEEKQVWKQSF